MALDVLTTTGFHQGGSDAPSRLGIYIQEDPGRPHHLLDSEPLHTGLQWFAHFEGQSFFILYPLTEVCTSTETYPLTPLDSTRCRGCHPQGTVTTLQADFLSHCEPVDLQPRPENPYSGHDESVKMMIVGCFYSMGTDEPPQPMKSASFAMSLSLIDLLHLYIADIISIIDIIGLSLRPFLTDRKRGRVFTHDSFLHLQEDTGVSTEDPVMKMDDLSVTQGS
ncbi:Hypothetical predicted protein [Xyrichtys novacula]|uniref:Uncharacterized protein n=1 Tax=Xyrichtys novacula TaxID=13765 RepID=A0AAV1FSK2_XYRNO|nr:Hypothetical predicted protein [Xyrichtys novacula]